MEFSNPHFPRIAADPEICFGKARIKGTRIPVSSVLAYLASGMTIEEFLAEFTWVTKEDVMEAIAFAGAMLQEKYLPLEKAS